MQNTDNTEIILIDNWIPKDPCFKGIYYRYNKDADTWTVYDHYYMGNLMTFSNKYRLDECFDIFNKEKRILGPGLWEQLKSSHKHYPGTFNKDIMLSAIKEFEKGSNFDIKVELIMPEYKYVPMSREEILNLKDGDICYIKSSYGMQKTSYPSLSGDTHRNLFGPGGANKTVEQKRDFGPIYKKVKINLVN